MIRAGSIKEIDHRHDLWAYLDLGFSKKETCGLIVGDEAPHELSYSDAVATLSSLPGKGHNTVNLVIEAPLSVAFDSRGNPTGRACELHNGQARYWYVGAGGAQSGSGEKAPEEIAAASRQRGSRRYSKT